jgi:hypothetical protein
VREHTEQQEYDAVLPVLRYALGVEALSTLMAKAAPGAKIKPSRKQC